MQISPTVIIKDIAASWEQPTEQIAIMAKMKFSGTTLLNNTWMENATEPLSSMGSIICKPKVYETTSTGQVCMHSCGSIL